MAADRTLATDAVRGLVRLSKSLETQTIGNAGRFPLRPTEIRRRNQTERKDLRINSAKSAADIKNTKPNPSIRTTAPLIRSPPVT